MHVREDAHKEGKHARKRGRYVPYTFAAEKSQIVLISSWSRLTSGRGIRGVRWEKGDVMKESYITDQRASNKIGMVVIRGVRRRLW